MASNLFRRTANGDLYAINLGAIIQDGQRIWDPSYSLSKDPEIWEKAQQDAVVSGAIERALLGVAGHEWDLEPFSDDHWDVKLAEVLTPLMQRIPRFYEARKNLAEARFQGSAFAKMTGDFQKIRLHDGNKRRWWVPSRLVDIDRRRLRAIAHRQDDGAYSFSFEMYSPGRKSWEEVDPKFPLVSHVYCDNESRLGFGRGVMDSIYFATYTRAVVLKDGLQGLRRWAQGLMVATVDLAASGGVDETNEDIRDGIKSGLLEMLGDNVLVVGEGDKIELHQTSGTGHSIVDKMLDRVERELNTRIEGTPISTMDGDGGGSKALGQEHGAREHAQRRFDRQSLGESLGSVVKFVQTMNRATLAEIHPKLASANAPRFTISESRNEDPKENAEVAKIALESGVALPLKDYHERIGWRQPDEGEDVVEPIQPPTAGAPGMGGMFGDPGPDQLEAAARRGAELAIRAMKAKL